MLCLGKGTQESTYNLTLWPFVCSRDKNVVSLSTSLKVHPIKMVFKSVGGLSFREIIQYLKTNGSAVFSPALKFLSRQLLKIVQISETICNTCLFS